MPAAAPASSHGDAAASMRRRPSLGSLGLVAIVGLSTVLHWAAGRRLHGLWIMPDEGVYGERAAAFWRDGPWALLHDGTAAYGLVYPAVAGISLAGSTVQGYASLKLLQALVVSLAAVPVFAYGRRLMPDRHALAAAALTVASPLLLYSGLLMTEVVFYPVAAWALLAMAHAIATGERRDQAVALAVTGLAILTRAQAVVFLVVFVLAIATDVAIDGRSSRLRLFWPTAAVAAAAVAVLVAAPGVVGAYAGTLRGSYPLTVALKLSFDHLSYIALSTGVVPAAAAVALLVTAVRRRGPSSGSRALLVVTASAAVVLSLQVGFFAARYAPTLLGRNLAPLPPLFFLVLALWVARGTATRVVAVASAFAVACLLLVAPWNDLVTPAAFANSLDLTVFTRLGGLSAEVAVTVFSLALLSLFVALPHRAQPVLPAVLLVSLTATSVVAADELHAAVNAGQAATVGPTRDWIDRVAQGDVSYLYSGEQSWHTVWHERFWNHRIAHVLAVRPSPVPGPMEQTLVTVPKDGRLPSDDPYVVAADRLTFDGMPVAHLAQTGLDVTGLTLWRLDGPLRLSTAIANVQPNGDITHPATVTVYDCRGGTLHLTLIPKATNVLRIRLNGKLALRAAIGGRDSWQGTVAVPPRRHGGVCTLTIVPEPLLGSTEIRFTR
jgi:hypothetical protein